MAFWLSITLALYAIDATLRWRAKTSFHEYPLNGRAGVITFTNALFAAMLWMLFDALTGTQTLFWVAGLPVTLGLLGHFADRLRGRIEAGR